MITIKAILFDADGVIQTTRSDFIPRLKSLLGEHPDNADSFIGDIFNAERPCLSGAADFGEELEKVLKRWEIKKPVDEVLMIWASIAIIPGVDEIIGRLRRSGTVCCLATNQQQKRATYMRSILGYDELFDRQYYSYEMGVVKPGIEYFQWILEDSKISAEQVLFVDDNDQNVKAAQSLGINGLLFNSTEHSEPCTELLGALQSFDVQIA